LGQFCSSQCGRNKVMSSKSTVQEVFRSPGGSIHRLLCRRRADRRSCRRGFAQSRCGRRGCGINGEICAGIDGGGVRLQSQIAAVVIFSCPQAVRAGGGVTHKKRVGVEIFAGRVAALDDVVCDCGIVEGRNLRTVCGGMCSRGWSWLSRKRLCQGRR
jgi:hypothetical protein